IGCIRRLFSMPQESMHPQFNIMHFETVRTLKARYFQYVDSKQWESLRGLFTPDAVFSGFPFEASNPDAFIANLSEYFIDVDSVHQGFMPILIPRDCNTIRGRWTMQDHLLWPRDSRPYRGEMIPGLRGIRGYGVYEEEYRLLGNDWKISRMRLARTRVELVTEELHLLSLSAN